ncbi:hypothetical protein AVEN_146087-1 [Araneus ventricosus]|uniref:Uncharacterized protein n=1 Tax=Araneus ventricosus TaxID=182803 RepID=A0A4Y2GNC0_ARAVE|nr:hypothetical protein AVEN_146087-1 [Araneus ventricosus]
MYSLHGQVLQSGNSRNGPRQTHFLGRIEKRGVHTLTPPTTLNPNMCSSKCKAHPPANNTAGVAGGAEKAERFKMASAAAKDLFPHFLYLPDCLAGGSKPRVTIATAPLRKRKEGVALG